MFTKKESSKPGKGTKTVKSEENPAGNPSHDLLKSNPSPLVNTPDPSIKKEKTKVTVKYDVGFPNQLYIRGKGGNLSWDKGISFKNVKSDEWVWETDTPFTQCEFKVLINDRIYESGDNHTLKQGASVVYTPKFY